MAGGRAGLFVGGAIVLLARRRHFWTAALPAVVISQVVITAAWSDARAGTIANLVVLVPAFLSLLDLRASSLRSGFDRELRNELAQGALAAPVTEADLAPLPDLVRTYLRRARGGRQAPRAQFSRVVHGPGHRPARVQAIRRPTRRSPGIPA